MEKLDALFVRFAWPADRGPSLGVKSCYSILLLEMYHSYTTPGNYQNKADHRPHHVRQCPVDGWWTGDMRIQVRSKSIR